MNKNKRPNILLLFTDQQRFDTIAALGNPFIKTPAMDRLVNEGTAFTRAYTPSPVCISGRCSLVTGLPAHVTGSTDNIPPTGEFPSFMEHLQKAGYQTHGTGKMHFAPDLYKLWGFEARDIQEEVVWEGSDYHEDMLKRGYDHVLEDGGMRSEYYYIPQPSQFKPEDHQSSWVADRSIEFLKNRDTSRPFFLWSSWVKPHPPFESPTPWSKLYRPEEVGHPFRPENGEDVVTFWNRIQNRYKWRDQGCDENLARTIRAAYMACISFVDYNIGRVFEELGDEIDNTLVILTADHGEMLGDYGCYGKRCMLDSAVRIPMLVRWPKNFAAGATCETPVSLLDIWPTLMEAAGIDDAPAPGSALQGIAGGEQADRGVMSQFQQKNLGLYMLAKRDWKYIYSAADKKEILMDVSGDALVKDGQNVAGDPQVADVLSSMRAELIGRLEADGYADAVENGQWKEYDVPDFGLDDPDYGLIYQDDPEAGGALQRWINELPEGYRRKVYMTGPESAALIESAIKLTR
jgi:arylsulfatase A-like enzyme